MNPVIPLPGTIWLHNAYKEFVPAYFHWSRSGREPNYADEPWMGFAHMDAICTLLAALQSGILKSFFMNDDGVVQIKPGYWRRGTRHEFIETGILADKKLAKEEENIFVSTEEFKSLMGKLVSGQIAEVFSSSAAQPLDALKGGASKGGRLPEYDWHKYLIEAAAFLYEQGTKTSKSAVYKHLQETLGGPDGGPSRSTMQPYIDPLIRRLQEIDRN